jgi:DNA-binding Lrp family transcriptional regulator
MKIDEKDLKILSLLQKNCKLTAREIARKINLPITTVFSRIRKMEKEGIIKSYRAILDEKKLKFGTTAFILASISYTSKGEKLSQREIAEKIAEFPEVQEVHIITGDWDLLIKVRAENVDNMGKFVVDRLRLVQGIEKTLTCMVFETCKETTELFLRI